MHADKFVNDYRAFLRRYRIRPCMATALCEASIAEMHHLLALAGYDDSELVVVFDSTDPHASQIMPRAVLPPDRH